MSNAYVQPEALASSVTVDGEIDDAEGNGVTARTQEPADAMYAPSTRADSTTDSLQLYLADVRKVVFLTPMEEYMLFLRARQNNTAARHTLIVSHLPLVVSIAKNYRGRELPFLDVIQEGTLGLDKAVDKFDYRSGYRLSAYATPLIHSAIHRALANYGRTIRVPVYIRSKLARIARAEHYLLIHLGREGTREEVSEVTGIPRVELDWLKRETVPPVSLDAPVNDEAESQIVDSIPDSSATSPFDHCVAVETSHLLRDGLRHLSDRERRVLELRYGLGEQEACTLEEIGRSINLTRERVRQIEVQALDKLRRLMVPRSAS